MRWTPSEGGDGNMSRIWSPDWVLSTSYRRLEKLIYMSQQLADVSKLLKRTPPPRSGTANSASRHFSIWRGHSKDTNFDTFIPKTDPFDKTALHNRVVKFHTTSLCLERPNRGHLLDAYNKYNRAALPSSVRSPRVHRGSWPIDDLKTTNIFIVGALTAWLLVGLSCRQ
jgi:hypothetical protein